MTPTEAFNIFMKSQPLWLQETESKNGTMNTAFQAGYAAAAAELFGKLGIHFLPDVQVSMIGGGGGGGAGPPDKYTGPVDERPSRQVPCPECKGSGNSNFQNPLGAKVECIFCDGLGTVWTHD